MQTILQNPLFIPLAVTVVIIAVFPLVAGYLTLVERKVLADFQVRLGPMRVGPHGLLQPIADALKLMLKEDIIPTEADRSIFWMAPVISTFTALTSFAVLPFSQFLYVADVNVGILVIMAMSAVGILGIILGGWGVMRSRSRLLCFPAYSSPERSACRESSKPRPSAACGSHSPTLASCWCRSWST